MIGLSLWIPIGLVGWLVAVFAFLGLIIGGSRSSR